MTDRPLSLALDADTAALVSRALRLEGFFPEFTPEHMQKLFPRSGLYLFLSGFRLIQQGEVGQDLFIICAGRVDINKGVNGGVPVTVATLGRGDIIGEIALIDNAPRTATAIVASDARIFRLAFADMEYIYKHNPDLSSHLRQLALKRKAN